MNNHNFMTHWTSTSKRLALAAFAFLVAYSLTSASASYAQVSSNTLSQTTFPPPIFYKIRSEPSYVVRIPFSDIGNSTYAPRAASLPIGMTVIWFNDDAAEHSVTTTSNSPEQFDSGPILPGGSFIHRFTHVGIYNYYDTFNPSTTGRIRVGNTMEVGNNFNMMIGGNNAIPFNSTKHYGVELSFVPKTVSIPPTISITYNVTLMDSKGAKLFSHNYDDLDGILDLELIPVSSTLQIQNSSSQAVTNTNQTGNAGGNSSSTAGQNNSTLSTQQQQQQQNSNATASIASQFNTWGPDFIGQTGHGSTGTFHIQGPVLTQNQIYYVSVSIVSKDNSVLPNPPSDTFLLPPISSNMTALIAQQASSPVHPTAQGITVTNGLLQNVTLTK